MQYWLGVRGRVLVGAYTSGLVGVSCLLQTFINERRLSSGGSMEVKALDIVKLGYGQLQLARWWSYCNFHCESGVRVV